MDDLLGMVKRYKLLTWQLGQGMTLGGNNYYGIEPRNAKFRVSQSGDSVRYQIMEFKNVRYGLKSIYSYLQDEVGNTEIKSI